MDLNTITDIVIPRTRKEVWPLDEGDAVMSGGTWLMSEPQVHLRRLIDLTGLGWEPYVISEEGLRLGATCTIDTISALSKSEAIPDDWTAKPLLHQCCTALLQSFKIWKTATIGGNLSLSFPAGSMISLAAGLDGVVTIWTADGGEYRSSITDFVTGPAENIMGPHDVLRNVLFPATAMRAKTAYRKIALSPLGRSGAVILGRRYTNADGGGFTLTVSGATDRPHNLPFRDVPTRAELGHALDERIPPQSWYTDCHGAADWRRAVTTVLAHEIREELA
ncbi:FAD binding domain-containing protein [Rhodococcus qingshengii]|uniref:FAD binding domain-containing protein n=1 Tax=Rhodococcus qingshengii TaxID=334542 RepID=UPI0035D8D948